MGCQILYAGPFGTAFDRIPDYVGCHSTILSRAVLQNPSEHFPFAHFRMAEPNVHKPLAPIRHRHRSYPSALAHQIDNNPVALPQLQLIQSQTHDFRATQSTSEQQSEHCSVSSTLQSVLRSTIQQLLCLTACQPIANLSPKPLDSLTRRMPVTSSGLSQPLSVASSASRRIAVRCRLIVAADRERLSRNDR